MTAQQNGEMMDMPATTTDHDHGLSVSIPTVTASFGSVWINPFSGKTYDAGWRARIVVDQYGPVQDYERVAVSTAISLVRAVDRTMVIEATRAVIEYRREYEHRTARALDYEVGIEPKTRRRGQRGALARHRRDTDRLEAELAEASQ